MATVYGALKPEGGIQRSVLVVNQQGRVTWSQQGMPSTDEILAVIDAMATDDPDSTRLSSS